MCKEGILPVEDRLLGRCAVSTGSAGDDFGTASCVNMGVKVLSKLIAGHMRLLCRNPMLSWGLSWSPERRSA